MSLIISVLLQRIKKDHIDQIKKSYENVITGCPNASKFRLDINDIITNRKMNCFSIIVVRLTNLDNINRYINYTIGEKALFEVLHYLRDYFLNQTLYSIYTNEIVVLLPDCSTQLAYSTAEKFMERFRQPVYIEGFPVNVILKCGITNYPLHSCDVHDLFKKMGRTLDQNLLNNSDISIYDSDIAHKNKTYFETITALYEAIQNDNFTIMYQPLINIQKNEVIGFEALLRTNINKLNIKDVITIAENAGIISDITKLVIRNVISQKESWRIDGLNTKVAINISSQDLKDDSIIEYTKKCIKDNNIKSSMLVFELTERVVIDRNNLDDNILNNIKDMGIEISLDDFGTGYNTFINLLNLPIDYIKVDKVFIDNIEDAYCRLLVEGIINSAHEMGMATIAEGVETKEQVEILKKMNCDNVQGYYYSKPLLPQDIEGFIAKFQNDKHTYAQASYKLLTPLRQKVTLSNETNENKLDA
jgi:EAL domain-containing protein (putative c-di-GMP-specific phosphodiesterase class I)